MSAEIEANRDKEPLGVSDAHFAYRHAAMILRDLEEIDAARNSQFGDLHERVGALREEFDAYKEEVCELRSALGSEAVSDRCQCGEALAGASSSKEFEELRMQLGGLEWRLNNLAEDFGDLVEVLRVPGLVVQVPEFEAAKKREADGAGREGAGDE